MLILLIIFTFDMLYRLKVPVGCTTELSHKGQEFLTLLFMQHDRDRDGALSPSEMESLFSRCLIPPWGDEYKYTVPTNEKVCFLFFIHSSLLFYKIFYFTFAIVCCNRDGSHFKDICVNGRC